jgi:TonB family protein
MKTISKLSILLAFFLFTNYSFAQEQEENIVLKTAKDTTQVNDSDDVFVFVEVTPQYPGGEDARLNYLMKNIHYPEAAKEQNIQGTVYITFIIEKDGRVTNVKVLRGIGGGCDAEAIRVIKSMPTWKPGTQKGKAVRCQYNMPIRFILAGGETPKPLTKEEKKALKKKEKKQKKEAKAKKKAAKKD